MRHAGGRCASAGSAETARPSEGHPQSLTALAHRPARSWLCRVSRGSDRALARQSLDDAAVVQTSPRVIGGPIADALGGREIDLEVTVGGNAVDDEKPGSLDLDSPPQQLGAISRTQPDRKVAGACALAGRRPLGEEAEPQRDDRGGGARRHPATERLGPGLGGAVQVRRQRRVAAAGAGPRPGSPTRRARCSPARGGARRNPSPPARPSTRRRRWLDAAAPTTPRGWATAARWITASAPAKASRQASPLVTSSTADTPQTRSLSWRSQSFVGVGETALPINPAAPVITTRRGDSVTQRA